jgi:hypothetical protein
VSFEADSYFTGWYFDLLRADPWLFIVNFVRRLHLLAPSTSLYLNIWTLPIVVVLAVIACRRGQEMTVVALPAILAVSHLLFSCWVNHMPRIVAPVRFLAVVSLSIVGAHICLYIWRSPLAHRLAAELRLRWTTRHPSSPRDGL